MSFLSKKAEQAIPLAAFIPTAKTEASWARAPTLSGLYRMHGSIPKEGKKKKTTEKKKPKFSLLQKEHLIQTWWTVKPQHASPPQCPYFNT